jgi:hypothetical protein
MPVGQLIPLVGHIFAFIHAELLCGNEDAAAFLSNKLNTPSMSVTAQLLDAISLQLPKVDGFVLVELNGISISLFIYESIHPP